MDLRRNEPRFHYRVTYRIQPQGPAVPNPPSVCLSNFPGEPAIRVNGQEVKRTEFEKRKTEWFPDLVFGYYSGGSRRLEALFDSHQRRYYDDIKLEDNEAKVAKAQEARRLFYCRPIHGVLAMLALFAFPDPKVTAELAGRLGITGFHSLLALFREPWFAKGRKTSADDLWGAGGPAAARARRFKELAFHPFALEGNAVDDYRDKKQVEPQFAAFLPSLARCSSWPSNSRTSARCFTLWRRWTSPTWCARSRFGLRAATTPAATWALPTCPTANGSC